MNLHLQTNFRLLLRALDAFSINVGFNDNFYSEE